MKVSRLWHVMVGSNVNGWGSAASPILFGDLLIVNASIESESLVALNKKTGKEAWKATGIRESWSTPLVVELPDGGRELVLSMHSKVLGCGPTGFFTASAPQGRRDPRRHDTSRPACRRQSDDKRRIPLRSRCARRSM
jgi:hypothetical protein